MGPWVTRLLIANVVIYIMTMSSPALLRLLMLVPNLVLVRPWTLFTYMFLHGSFFHLLFNMLGLFFFGTRLEHRLGSRDFLRLYVFSGLAGAALHMVVGMLLGGSAPVIGASGAVYGVLLGFARFWPDEPIYIWGVLPVPAKWLVVALTAMSLWSGFSPRASTVAHFAHLGGFVGGWLFLKWRERGRRQFQAAARPTRPVLASSASLIRKWEAIPRDRLHEINRAEVDRILGKLKEQGFESLTQSERDYMDRMAM